MSSLNRNKPKIMGILNLTPDSFSDGGEFNSLDNAIEQGKRMINEGADIIDVGGESTRPGASPVSIDLEFRRVIPVIRRLAEELTVPLSIDTSRPEIMIAAAEAGAGMINDVRALREPGALSTVVDLGLPVCLMHMKGEPATMQHYPQYKNVVQEVYEFLNERLNCCQEAGIPGKNILVDPGFGFGKSPEHNRQLLKSLDTYLGLGVPMLVGLSRKSFSDAKRDRTHRDQTTSDYALTAVVKGAAIVRVHNVKLSHTLIRSWERNLAGSTCSSWAQGEDKP